MSVRYGQRHRRELDVAKTLRLGSKLGTPYSVAFRIQTPIIQLSKAEIVRLAIEAGAPLELTWSCYEGGVQPCGRCDTCLLRARGFAEAGVAGPIEQQLRLRRPSAMTA